MNTGQELVPYDENLLEVSRTQWQFGDWKSLAKLKLAVLQHHPDRANLALLAAAGLFQIGIEKEGKQFLRLSMDWGVSKSLVSKILIAGVYNSLGRAAYFNNRDISTRYFEKSIAIGSSRTDVKLFSLARENTQHTQIKLLAELKELVSKSAKNDNFNNETDKSYLEIFDEPLECVRQENKNILIRIIENNEIKKEELDPDSGNYLAELCDKFGSDKGSKHLNKHPYPWRPHNYTHYYDFIFKHKRMSVMSLFECGIGTNNINVKSNMSSEGIPGASLRVWREYFPNAIIIGGDIDSDILFNEDRIITFEIDQLNRKSIQNFWGRHGYEKVDVIIDDGLHEFKAGITLFEESIAHLSNDGCYVIEDVIPEDIIKYIKYFDGKPFKFKVVIIDRPYAGSNDNNLVVISKSN